MTSYVPPPPEKRLVFEKLFVALDSLQVCVPPLSSLSPLGTVGLISRAVAIIISRHQPS